jgi:hypothetical protein
MEAMRALKRRLSDVVYRQMTRDSKPVAATSPGGQRGATLQSSAAGPKPPGQHFGTVTSRTRQSPQ